MPSSSESSSETETLARRLAVITGLAESEARELVRLLDTHIEARLATKADIARLEQSIAEQPGITRSELRTAIGRLHRTDYAQLIELVFWSAVLLGAVTLFIAVAGWVK